MTCSRVALSRSRRSRSRSSALAQSPSAYRVPPAPIPAILDAPPVPSALLSPTGDRLVLLQPRAMPSIAEMAEPVRRLAGVRFAIASGAPVGGLELRGRFGRWPRRPDASPCRHPIDRR